MRKYYSEQGAINYAKAIKQYYGRSVLYGMCWYVGTKRQLELMEVRKILE